MSVVCSICIDSLLSSTSVGLDCGHIYHQSCIKDWMKCKSSCPICKVAIKKKIGRTVYLSTHEAGPSETGPPDQRVVEENEALKTRISKLNESVAQKDREIIQLKEKQNQQSTTLQYLKQLKRVADMDDDLAKPTSKALVESMRALPREELVCSLASIMSKLRYNKRETEKLTYQLQKSNKIIEEYVEENVKKERELCKYREKYPQEITEDDAQPESSKRPKKRKRAAFLDNVFSRATSSSSINTSNLASISLTDDDDNTDDDISPFLISEHRRGGDSSSSRHILPGCHYCRGVPSLPNDIIQSTRRGQKCTGCDRRLLYPNDGIDEIMISTPTRTIDVDAPISSRNQNVCIVLSDDEDDSTSDEM